MLDIENRLLEQMLLVFADRYVVLDEENRYLYAFSNPDGHASFLVEPADLIGKKLGYKLSSELKDLLEKAIDRARETGKQQTVEYSYQLKDLGEQFFETKVQPTSDNRIILVARTITRRVLALRRENFIRNSTQVLNSSLDYRQTLRALLDVLATGLGDIVVVRILNEEGRVGAIEFKCCIPEKDALASEVVTRYGWNQGNQHVGAKTVRSKKAALNRVTAEDYFRSIAEDEEHLKLLLRLGTVSSMAVPMTYGERILGSLAVMSLNKDRHYDETDLSIFEEIAKHASVAMDRALAHERAIKAVQVSEEVMKITSQGIAGPSKKIGHEVEQVLSVISRIEDPNLRRQISKSVKTILRSNEEIEAKLEELKEAGNFWLSRKILESAPHHLKTLLEQVISSCARQAEDRSIRFETKFAKDVASILCDPEGLTSILREWIFNLIKVTQRNGTIKLDVTQDQCDVVLSISRPQHEELGPEFDPLKTKIEAMGGRIIEEAQKPATPVTLFKFSVFNPS
jgi:signal transduction histidine kinase